MVKKLNIQRPTPISKPNRATRRAMKKQQMKDMKKEMKKHNPHDAVVLISCPDCGSTRIIDSDKKDYYKCENCGSEHPLSEMDVNL